jgi:hypothetical protein
MAPDVQWGEAMRKFALVALAALVLFGCDLVTDSTDPKPADFELDAVTQTADPSDAGFADEGG